MDWGGKMFTAPSVQVGRLLLMPHASPAKRCTTECGRLMVKAREGKVRNLAAGRLCEARASFAPEPVMEPSRQGWVGPKQEPDHGAHRSFSGVAQTARDWVVYSITRSVLGSRPLPGIVAL